MKSFSDYLAEVEIIKIPMDADIMRQINQTVAMLSRLEPSQIGDHKGKIIELQKTCDEKLSGF